MQEGNDALVSQMAKDVVCITAKGKPIKAKTVGQQKYMKAIQANTITIGVGPAGFVRELRSHMPHSQKQNHKTETILQRIQ